MLLLLTGQCVLELNHRYNEDGQCVLMLTQCLFVGNSQCVLKLFQCKNHTKYADSLCFMGNGHCVLRLLQC